MVKNSLLDDLQSSLVIKGSVALACASQSLDVRLVANLSSLVKGSRSLYVSTMAASRKSRLLSV